MLNSFEEGYVIGILMGEGHFGGDGKQAQVTLRMDIKHEKLFFWLRDNISGSKLYGPYHHGGRHYYQWMIRGTALKHELLPIIQKNIAYLDDYTQERFTEMCTRYHLVDDSLTEIGA